jgi:DNA helicase HerA-like ATPase
VRISNSVAAKFNAGDFLPVRRLSEESGCTPVSHFAARSVPRGVNPQAYTVTEIPRRPERPDQAGGDSDRWHRVTALAAAYHAGLAAEQGTVTFGWVRTEAGGPVQVVVAGDALVGGAAGAAGSVLLALPSGAAASALPAEGLDRLRGRLSCWRPVAGISDGLLISGETSGAHVSGAAAGRARAISLDEALLGSWTGPFGWLVTADPIPPAELAELAAEVGRQQRLAERDADRFPERAAAARRLSARHAEFQRGGSTGFWRITVTVGGRDEATAARLAGILCASLDLDGLPYVLTPAVADAPFCGSTQLLAALARPPEAEVPGVRLALRPEFDVTPEPSLTGVAGRGGIELGEVLDRNLMPAGPFTLTADSLNRHVLVCGATGAGKSQTVRALLEAATRQGVPWLVVEPAKAEYRLMAGRLPDTEVIRIRPGEPDVIAAGLNPLEPAVAADGTRFPLQTHADLTRALFIASFRSEEPFPQVLSAALGRAYTEAGWDLVLGEAAPAVPGARYPTLTELQRAAEQVVTEIGYSQRVTDDVLGFIRVRLASLRLGTTGRFLEGGHPIDFCALLRSNVVLEIEDVGDDADKAFLMGAVLIRLVEQLRLTKPTARAGASPLSHLTVIEEAHRLLRRTPPSDAAGGGGAAGHAVEMFAGLLAEIRAYGEGLVIAEQIPSLLVPDVIKNTAVKIAHRLPAADDREAVGATMNATPAQSRYLVTLSPGQAAACADGMDFPVLIKVKDGTERERLTPAAARDPRTVVHPRSASCGTECTARPCTLRELRTAQRALDDVGLLRLWAELGVLAHLTGWPLPVPKPEALARLRALPRRTAECAVGHAVDAAVAARPAVPRPAALAGHVAAAIRARSDRAEWLCAPAEPEWLLPGPARVGLVSPGNGQQSVSAEQLAEFIECDWPLGYLAG